MKKSTILIGNSSLPCLSVPWTVVYNGLHCWPVLRTVSYSDYSAVKRSTLEYNGSVQWGTVQYSKYVQWVYSGLTVGYSDYTVDVKQ